MNVHSLSNSHLKQRRTEGRCRHKGERCRKERGLKRAEVKKNADAKLEQPDSGEGEWPRPAMPDEQRKPDLCREREVGPRFANEDPEVFVAAEPCEIEERDVTHVQCVVNRGAAAPRRAEEFRHARGEIDDANVKLNEPKH